MGLLDILLISEGMRKNSIDLACNSCGHEWNVSLTRTEELPDCPKCNAKSDTLKELNSISLIDELTILAEKEIQDYHLFQLILRKARS